MVALLKRNCSLRVNLHLSAVAMSASSNTTLPPYLFDAAKAAEEDDNEKQNDKESLWNLEFLRTTKGMLLVAQVVSHSSYRMVQLNVTPEIEVFYILFERSLSIFSMRSVIKFPISCVKSSWTSLYMTSTISLDLFTP